jgi:hypothetical protein
MAESAIHGSEVDREHGDRNPGDRPRDRTHRVACFLGEIRNGLDAGVRDHRDRDRKQERAPRRCDAEMDVLRQHVRMEDQEEPEPDEQQLRREVDHRQEDVEPGCLLNADDVEADQQPGEREPDDDVPRIGAQRLPEDREVVRHEDHRDCDGDHVVEHLCPRRRERDELVEGMPRKARRPARFRVANGSFRVGRRRRGEDDAADDEDDRGQAERDPGGQAERVVDRRADVAVRGREESRRPEDPFEPAALTPTPWHRRDATARGSGRYSESRAARKGGTA